MRLKQAGQLAAGLAITLTLMSALSSGFVFYLGQERRDALNELHQSAEQLASLRSYNIANADIIHQYLRDASRMHLMDRPREPARQNETSDRLMIAQLQRQGDLPPSEWSKITDILDHSEGGRSCSLIHTQKIPKDASMSPLILCSFKLTLS